MAGRHLSLVAFAYTASVLHRFPTALVDGGDSTTCVALNALNDEGASRWCIKSCGSTPSICPPDLCTCASPTKWNFASSNNMGLATPDAQPPAPPLADAGAEVAALRPLRPLHAVASASDVMDMSAIATNTAAVIAAVKRHISQRRTTKKSGRQRLGKGVVLEVETADVALRDSSRQNTSTAARAPSNVKEMGTTAANAAAVIKASELSVANAQRWLSARRTTKRQRLDTAVDMNATAANTTAVISAAANWMKDRSKQRLEAEVALALKAAALKAEQIAVQRATAAKVAADTMEEIRLAREKAMRDEVLAGKAKAARASAVKAAADQAAADQVRAIRLAREKAVHDKVAADKAVVAKASAAKVAADQEVADKMEAIRQAREKAMRDDAAAGREVADKAEAKLAAAKDEAQRVVASAREEAQKVVATRLATEKLAERKALSEKLAAKAGKEAAETAAWAAFSARKAAEKTAAVERAAALETAVAPEGQQQPMARQLVTQQLVEKLEKLANTDFARPAAAKQISAKATKSAMTFAESLTEGAHLPEPQQAGDAKGPGKIVLKEKNHRFNGRFEEVKGDLKHTCPEIEDEELCGRAVFWEYSIKQVRFECKWKDLDGDLKYSCRDKTSGTPDVAAAPESCTMCKFLGHPAPALSADAPEILKAVDVPKEANSHEGTVAQYQLCLEGAHTLSQVRACKAAMPKYSADAAEEKTPSVTAGDEAFIADEAAGAATAVGKPATQLAPEQTVTAPPAGANTQTCVAWCSKWTNLAPECAGCESTKPKKGGLSILDFLHDKQAKGVPPEDAASVVESEPPQNPSVAYQIATPDRQGKGDTTVMKAPKRKCQSQWDGDCDRSDLHEPLQRPCQSLWDGDCDRSALRELRLPNQGPSREEWASKEAKASQEKVQRNEKQVQQQEKQDRATLLESSGLDELMPVAVPG